MQVLKSQNSITEIEQIGMKHLYSYGTFERFQWGMLTKMHWRRQQQKEEEGRTKEAVPPRAETRETSRRRL